MVDLHTHFLPAMDDGPATLEEAVAMAAVAVEEGIEAVVVTPHYTPGQYEPTEEEIRAGLALLQQAVAQEGLEIDFYPGMEVHAVEDVVVRLQKGQALTLNRTSYVLLELPFIEFPLMTRHLLFDLALKGYRPILAHVERYRPIQEDPSLLYRWAQGGVLAQVTAGSLLGHYGEPARVCAFRLLEHRLVQFLASDAHDAQRRAPRLRKSLDLAMNLLGEKEARALVETNPSRVLANEAILVEPEEPPPPRTWLTLGRWWRR